MSFQSALIQNVFMLRWHAHEAGDAKRLLKAVVNAKGQVTGPMVYVAIAPADVLPPAERVRTELAEALDQLLVHCSCVHLVIEATGFRGVAARAAATGIFMITGKRGRVSPHPSIDDALTSCEHACDIKAQLLNSARLQGLVPGAMASQRVANL